MNPLARSMLLVVPLLPACAHGASVPAPVRGPLAPLAFIAGTWRSEVGGTVVEEQWTAPRAGSMLGTGRVIVGERTVFFEFLRVEATADGVVYTAMPRGGAATAFRLASSTAREAVFVNPAHDFPSRIVYRRADDGALITRVEGAEDGRARAEETRLVRAP